MKRGQKVFVCHDGKWGRRVEGEVIQTDNGSRIKVGFMNNDKYIEFWARKVSTIHYRRQNPGSCIVNMKQRAYFAGWAEGTDCWFPWFTVRPLNFDERKETIEDRKFNMELAKLYD